MSYAYKSNHKPGIDALRALSVLLVLFYHAKLEYPFLSIVNFNGFLGVDIFFVISGYLITKILHEEYYKTKNLSLLNFYLRRAKSSFKLLDEIKHPNLYRVYPHEIFCDSLIKDRCIIYDEKNLFYSDYNHPSVYGSDLINDLIISKINTFK